MLHIGFYCRGKCSAETLHGILAVNEEGPHNNYAKLKCIKCNEPELLVEYPKGHNAPTSISRRVGGELQDDEQPTDIC